MKIMAGRRDIRRWQIRVAALLAVAAFSALPLDASAEVRIVESGSGTLVVEAHEAAVQDVLAALGASRSLDIHTSGALSRVITGTYSGSLPRVLARILDGYNHVIQPSPAGTRVSVFGTGTVVTTTPYRSALPVMSGNVDLDEENAQASAGHGARSPAVTAPAPVSAPLAVPSVAPIPAALAGGSQDSGSAFAPNRPGGPRISNNVDLDDETAH